MELDDIAKKVEEAQGIRSLDFLKMVQKKKIELEGLVSDVGAAHIVANELGVATLPKPKEPLINELEPGTLNSITVNVTSAYPAKEFTTKDGRKGMVANIIVEDETGTSRVVLWGSHTKTSEEVGHGGKLKIVNAFVKEGLKGLEIHVGNKSRITTLEKGTPYQGSTGSQTSSTQTVGLDHLEEGMFVRAKATVRKILASRSFWRCKQRECPNRGETCPTHGKGEEVPVVTAILDDGLREIRAVFFADKSQLAVPGNEMYFIGKAKKNDFRGDLELSIFRSEPVYIRQEIENLLA